MKSKNVQTSECKELLLLFNSSSSFCLSSINVKMVLLAYLKELQCVHHQLQFIEDRLEILCKSHPITMEDLLSKFSRSKWVLHQLRWTTSGAILEKQFGGGSHTNVFHLRSFVELTRLIFFTVFILSVYILYDQNRYAAFQIDLKCPPNVFKVTENSYKYNLKTASVHSVIYIKKSYGSFFMDGIQLSQDYRAAKWTVYFLPFSPLEFLGVNLGAT